MTAGQPGTANLLRGLLDANVQFVAVGDSALPPLRLVVSRHPTNLDALGRVLDTVGAVVRAAPPEGEADGERRYGAPQRVGDPHGTVALSTRAGDVDLLFGGVSRSLYAEIVTAAEDREVGGVVVRWVGELPEVEPPPRATSRMLGRRLLSLAEGLAHMMEPRADGSEEREGDRTGEGGSGARGDGTAS